MPDDGGMVFDPLIANAGRLRILTALAVENRQDFVRLRRLTHLTDGNLSAHAKRLASAGMIDRTGAENVSAASSGSRIVRSARSTNNAAPSANSSPPNKPPSAGSVVA